MPPSKIKKANYSGLICLIIKSILNLIGIEFYSIWLFAEEYNLNRLFVWTSLLLAPKKNKGLYQKPKRANMQGVSKHQALFARSNRGLYSLSKLEINR